MNDIIWPSPMASRLVMEFEGPPRMIAEQCEGGAWEIGWGSTFHLDGRPVREHETCTLEYALELRAFALRTNYKPVFDALKFKPTQHQADALAVFAYNLGPQASASEVVEMANLSRWEDAAERFSNWISARETKGPSEREIDKRWVPKSVRWDYVDGVPRWLGPDGQPCGYRRKMRGLLRRRHAEACLFLGKNWLPACEDSRVFLSTRADWDSKRNRWADVVLEKTEFKSIYAIAAKYPLEAEKIAAEPDPPKAPAPIVPVEVEALPEITLPAPEIHIPEPPKVETPVTTPTKPTVSTAQLPYGSVEPVSDPKDMIASKRFWGLVILVVSRFGMFGLAGQTWAGELVGDPILLDAAAAGLAMGALFIVDAGGQALHYWGRRSATAFLK